MTDLSQRAIADEQMDSLTLPQETYAAVLRDLSRVNGWTMAARPTLAFLDRMARRGDSLRILDVGFGAGDMLRRIARWGRKRGVETILTGIDLNPRSAEIARAATPADMAIEYLSGDYADLRGRGWDVVLSNLVAHHMSTGELVAFIHFMEQEARCGWLVNDLMRHPFSHRFYPLLARVMGWHPIVRQDGQLSIARSYRPAEWVPLLDAAGAGQARVYRAFPFRLCVER